LPYLAKTLQNSFFHKKESLLRLNRVLHRG
jgi:hypothetical protein